jgi:hypothetical protein
MLPFTMRRRYAQNQTRSFVEIESTYEAIDLEVIAKSRVFFFGEEGGATMRERNYILY